MSADDADIQSAARVLKDAELVAISTHALCEFVWVLSRRYKTAPADIATAIRNLLSRHDVVVDRPKAEAGVRVLEAGGDFADGVINYEGHWLGGETFVSFDQKAAAILADRGHSIILLASQ